MVQKSATADPLIGRTISQYDVLAKLGGGGMGVVYKARDVKLGRAVALKFLPPEWSHDEGAKQRFVREAQAASATNHRSICVIHNIEETDEGRLFIVMAYYEGETLKQRLEQGPLAIADAVEIGCAIAEGLAKAHGQGVVHRDVKPGNLIVTDDGVKILDFGLAKFADALQLTVPGTTIGTVAYMSPEQARGEEADARSDVWALGVVMFEMLAGAAPFRGAYPEAMLHAIKYEPLPSLRAVRPDVPDPLERIVLKALEKDPAQRYQSAREVARDLRLLQGRTVPLDLQTEALPPVAALRPAAPPPSSRLRRALTPARALVAVLLIAAAAAAAVYWMRRPVERIRVAIVPVANQTGVPDLDRYRLALTETLIDEIGESPNVRVVPYLRLIEMIRPFLGGGADMSSNEAIRAIGTASGAPFLVLPTLVYRDRDRSWLLEIQVRNAQTGTTVGKYETAGVTSSLQRQTAFRLVTSGADSVQQHFKVNGPGRSFQQRATASRFREPEAALAFEEGLNAYEALEYGAALVALTRSRELEDQHALTHAWLSRVLLLLGRRNDAVTAARQAGALAAANQSGSDSRFVSAVLAESEGDLAAAHQRFRDLAAFTPDDPFALAELADFLKRRQDQNQAAIDAYHAVLRADAAYIRPRVDLCQLYTRIDDHPLAEREGRAALERYRELGIKSGEAQALLCLSETARLQGGTHLDEARRHVETARTLFQELRQPYNLSRAVNYQGLVAFSSGRPREAAAFFEDAVARAHEVGNRLIEGLALMNGGAVSVLLGQPSRAIDFDRRGRDVFLAVGDERRVAEMDVNAAGLVLEYGGDRPAALRTITNASANLERLGHVDFQLRAMISQAQSYLQAGQVERSRVLLGSALDVAKRHELAAQQTVLRVRLAEADLEANDYAAARTALEDMAKSAVGSGRFAVSLLLGTVLMRLGELDEARRHLAPLLPAVEQQQRFDLFPIVHHTLGTLAYESRDSALARRHFDAAVRLWTDPLPHAASVESLCDRGLQDSLAGRRAAGRADVEAGVAAAARTGRRRLDAHCRVQLARVHFVEGRFAEMEQVLHAIPDDVDDGVIGPELRAQVDFWRAVALEAKRDGQAASWYERSRDRIAKLQASIPAAARDTFAARPDIGAILQKTVRVSR